MQPSLRKCLGDFEIPQPVRIRPVDLYVTSGHRQAGIALVGDAFATSCPAAGTGCNKVFTDVESLCNVHIPRWLATAGMGEDKIAAFYDDEVKRRAMPFQAKAYYLRSLSTDTSLVWRARRTVKFVGQLAVGKLRRAAGASGEARRPLAGEDRKPEAPPVVSHIGRRPAAMPAGAAGSADAETRHISAIGD